VLVSQGFKCFDLKLGSDMLWSLPNFASGAERASSSGMPILFPFPGRIPGTRFTWKGQTYDLEPGDKFGNAIHGFCHTRAWRIIDQQPDSVTGEFHAAADDPALLARWPSDFRIRAKYRLTAGLLSCEFHIDNPGTTPLPFGLGVHPYFRVPLAASSQAEDCVVRLPVTQHWQLRDMLPTGEKNAWPQAKAYAAGMRFGDLALDDVFAGLTFAGDECRAEIADPGGRTLTIAWDRAFRECVVYTPPHREAICIEPYTCVPGALTLAERGIDAGLQILAPGESFSARMKISVT
jgi:aldose 1-epimerase